MEDLTRRCDRLSLFAKEGEKVILTKSHASTNHVLVAKFFTKRSLNMEAIVRTFRLLWDTKESFEVTNMGNNVMLFTFGLEVDAEKVLLGEPWSYDRHLVILQRFDESKPISELEFKYCSFWVQIHDLPFKFMNSEMVVQIRETIGLMIKSQDLSKMKGGCFMRVRTTIDVTQPLCRGRRIVFDEDLVG